MPAKKQAHHPSVADKPKPQKQKPTLKKFGPRRRIKPSQQPVGQKQQQQQNQKRIS
jgi:hypothetical protein